MAVTLERPAAVARGILTVAGLASIAAGVIHAAAIAAHSEHRQAVWAFVGVAVVQLAWGAAAVARPQRAVALVGVLVGAGALAGWVVAKRNGIPFIEGLDEAEPVRWSDAFAASLAATSTVLAAGSMLARRVALPKVAVGFAAAALFAVTAPAADAALDHDHGRGDDHGDEAVAAEPVAAVPPRPFDPAMPIDLGGVDGVSPEQQARAENLLASTVQLLPQWADPAYAEANGFWSIGDGVLGTEHFLNREFMDDDVILDPTRPESLVFDVDQATGERTLSAAMFMLRPGETLDDVPDVGGPLTQWHIHNNLCFNPQGQVRGLTDAEGNCGEGLVKGEERPMIHVWIRSHQCGPFAALEGVGGGQVAEGEEVACDHVHGT